MRVLGLSGSLRSGSHNSQLLRAATKLLPPGTELVEFTDLKAIPPFDEDDEHTFPEPVLALHEAVAAADAVLVATPEYNHSLPGQLKNALDWLSRPHGQSPVRGKPVAVVGATQGLFGAVWAQAEGRKVLATMGADVLDRELPVGQAHEAFTPHGTLADPDLAAAYGDLLAELTRTTLTVLPLAA